MDDVFIGSEAAANGTLTRGRLRSNYRPLFPDVYIAREAIPSLAHRTVGRGCGHVAAQWSRVPRRPRCTAPDWWTRPQLSR